MKSVMNNIPDNIEDLYINEDNNKYVHDDNFLFKDITENIIGPVVNIYSGLAVSIINEDYIGGGYLNVDVIEKIKKNIIDDFIDKPDVIPNIFQHIDTDFSTVVSSTVVSSTVISSTVISSPVVENDNQKDVIIEISNIPENKDNNRNNHNNFFDCFNEENSVNNVIACNTIHNKKKYEMTTSYMFESEDLRKNDIYPFSQQHMKKNRSRGWLESLGIITTSAISILKNITED